MHLSRHDFKWSTWHYTPRWWVILRPSRATSMSWVRAWIWQFREDRHTEHMCTQGTARCHRNVFVAALHKANRILILHTAVSLIYRVYQNDWSGFNLLLRLWQFSHIERNRCSSFVRMRNPTSLFSLGLWGNKSIMATPEQNAFSVLQFVKYQFLLYSGHSSDNSTVIPYSQLH
jgi:hypothetical protein